MLIVGLGNPEKNYKGTRHNVGFEVVNQLAHDHNIPIARAKFRAHWGEGKIAGVKVLLAKPQTYMNLSGEAVGELMAFFRCTPKDLIVVYDDTNLPVGEIRVREQGSAGGQNGMKNIIQRLGTDQFTRVRVGIGEKPPGWDLADYVLSRFKKEEIEGFIDGVNKAAAAVELILAEGVAAAMNRYNKIHRANKPEGETSPKNGSEGI